ncbi:MAG: hypothetical protein WD845_04285, partial [Pirellulales bacterium]
NSWHVFLDDGEKTHAVAPLVSAYWDRSAGELSIVRRILTHGFEAYEDSPGVFLSRPSQKWARELVGTIDLATISDDELAGELRAGLFLAVIGVSRLPITSLESPLPSFSLGQFAYFPRLTGGGQSWWTVPLAFLRADVGGRVCGVEFAKSLEMALRATPDERQPQIANALESHAAATSDGAQRVGDMIRDLFRYISLSPYGTYADRMIAMLATLAECDAVGVPGVADSIATMLRQLCRHLTAFDLATFHNSGANYPDALFLDALLKQYLRLVERQPELLVDEQDASAAAQPVRRIRRRALRQACLLRQHYEGLRVPDAPTSQGESLRVLPEPLAHVPQEQISQPARRRRVLFADEPLDGLLTPIGRQALQSSLTDLDQAAELLELGRAYFLDRPLGVLKQPGEVDRTPLVSHTAVSRTVVKRRLAELLASGWITAAQREGWRCAVDVVPIAGVGVGELTCVERPGVVTLADALKVAPDFILQRSAASEVLRHYAWPVELQAWLADFVPPGSFPNSILVHHVLQSGHNTTPLLQVCDRQGRKQFELGFDLQPDGTVRYVQRAGVELPQRLQVLRLWDHIDASGQRIERDLQGANLWLTLRDGRTSS